MGRVSVARVVVVAIGLMAWVGTLAQAPTKQMKMSAGLARLDKKVDAKNAKVGDVVTAHLMDAISCEDGTTLPKDATLSGKVVEVSPSVNKGESKLVLLFDQVMVKGKAPIPVKVTIQGLIPPPVSGPDTTGSTQAVPNNPSGIRGAPVASSVASDRVQEANGLAGQQPSTVPGVTLTGSITDANSGTLSSTGHNAKLEMWTQMQIAIIPIPPNAVIK